MSPTTEDEFNEVKESIKSNSYPLQIIKGWVGSGKTTYIRKLKHDIESEFEETRNDYNFIALDFNVNNTNPYELNGKPLSYGGMNNVEDSILRMLSAGIVEGLYKGDCESDDGYKSRVKEYINIHKNYYRNDAVFPPQSDGIFDVFFSRLKNTIDSTTEGTLSSLPSKVAETVNEFLQDTVLDKSYAKDKRDIIGQIPEKPTVIIGLVSRLLFCLSMIDKKKHYIIIDNLEHFIREEPYDYVIDEKDLIYVFRTIFGQLRNDYVQLKEKVENNVDHPYFGYGFIVGCRQTTMRMIGRNLNENESYLSWEHLLCSSFCLSEILLRRIEYLKNLNSSSTSAKSILTGLILMHDMLNDYTLSVLSLGNHLEQMYNCNIRRIFRFLGHVINGMNETPAHMEFYKKLWDRVFKHPDEDNTMQQIKRLFRSFVIANLLCIITDDYCLDNTSLVSRHISSLLLSKGDRGPTGTENSYCRRILSTLSHFEDNEIRNIRFGDFVKSIIHSVKNLSKDSEEATLDVIIRLLFHMNNKSWAETGWASLVIVETNLSGYYDFSKFKSQLTEHYNNNSEIALSITQAGYNFLNNSSCFEFFAWRYVYYQYKEDGRGQYILANRTNMPLLSVQNMFRNENRANKFGSLEIIKKTRQMTKQCVVKMIETDENFFDPGEINIFDEKFLHTQYRRQMHAVRIYDRHIEYLRAYSHYISYLLSLPDDDVLIKCLEKIHPRIDIRSQLSTLVSQVENSIYQYRLDANELYADNPRYFNRNRPHIETVYNKLKIDDTASDKIVEKSRK